MDSSRPKSSADAAAGGAAASVVMANKNLDKYGKAMSKCSFDLCFSGVACHQQITSMKRAVTQALSEGYGGHEELADHLKTCTAAAELNFEKMLVQERYFCFPL